MNLRTLLLIHALITLAAGIVLVLYPALIPGAVGISLAPEAYLLCYLLAASEIGLASLSFYSRRLTDAEALRIVCLAIIVTHTLTAALELYAYTRGLTGKILMNVTLRALVVALFAYYRPRKAKAANG